MKIALFTAFSPDIGGGAAQIRSVLPELRDLEIKWYYLAPREASSYAGEWLGAPLHTGTFLADLAGRTLHLPGSGAPISHLVGQINADVYWIVAHNEGVSVAAELIAARKHVHLSVHDDPAVVFTRSKKYRPFRIIMSQVFRKVLREASTVDVISSGMQECYRREYGIECPVLYRFAPALPDIQYVASNHEMRVGHIGSLYDPEPFRCFVKSCDKYSATNGRSWKIVTIGTSPHLGEIASEHPGRFEPHGQMDEASAIEVLSSCEFVYAMYPGGRRFRRFRETSVPMKLSTYILAQRPLFAHTPIDSTLATTVSRFGIGEVCATNDASSIDHTIHKLLESSLGRRDFEVARSSLLGSAQIRNLRAALGARSAPSGGPVL